MYDKEIWDKCPIEIQEFMLHEQFLNKNTKDPVIFQNNFTDNCFTWRKCSYGDVYTELTDAHNGSYDSFLKRFPIGDTYFDGLPDKLKKIMCDEQVNQGNAWDPQVFRDRIYADKSEKGFDWDDAKIKLKWDSILNDEDLKSYYRMFPNETSSSDSTPKVDYKIIRETECGLLVAGPKDDETYCSKCLYTGKICDLDTDRRKICKAQPNYYFIKSSNPIEKTEEPSSIPSEFPWGFDTLGRTYKIKENLYVLRETDKSDETIQFEMIYEDGNIDTEWFDRSQIQDMNLVPCPKPSICLDDFKTKTIIITEPSDSDDSDYQPYLDKLWKILKKASLDPCEDVDAGDEKDYVYQKLWIYTQIHKGELCKIDDLGENLDSDVLADDTIYLSYKDIIELDLGESIPETTKNPCNEVILPKQPQSCTLEVKEAPQPIQQQNSNNTAKKLFNF